MKPIQHPKRYRRVPHTSEDWDRFRAEIDTLLDRATTIDAAQRDLATELGSALQEPTAVTTCPSENAELKARFENLRPAVRNLTESLTSLASADDGIAVFVPALPGR